MSLALIQQLIKNNHLSHLDAVLEAANEHKSFYFNKDNISDFVSYINTLLSDKSKRRVGLQLVRCLLPQCPADLLSSNAVSWLQQSTKCLTTEEGGVDRSICSLLRDLIECSTKFPEVKKDTALNIIPKLNENILRQFVNLEEADKLLMLECLDVILKNYGKSCGNQRKQVEAVLFSNVECSSLADGLVVCFLRLCETGGPGLNADNHKMLYLRYQKIIINCLHHLLRLLFVHINEAKDDYKTYQLDDDVPQLPKVSDVHILGRVQRLSTQFINLSKFLKILLIGGTSMPKRILHEGVFGVVCRALAVNLHVLQNGRQSSDTVHLSTVISSVNVAAFHILQAFVISCRLEEASYSPLIARLISHTLKWSQVPNWEYGLDKPHQVLRVAAYHCLKTWLQISGPRSFYSAIEKYLPDIVHSILSDIHIEPPSVALNVPRRKLKRKAGKKYKAELLAMSTSRKCSFVVRKNCGREVCEAALLLIPLLLRAVSGRISQQLYQDIEKKVIYLLVQLQELTCTKLGQVELPVPYGNETCRLKLYAALAALCHHVPRSSPPPVNYAYHLFKNGLSDHSIKVSYYCSEFLDSSIRIFSSSFPTLNLASDYEQSSRISYSTFEEIRQKSTENQESFSCKSVRENTLGSSTPLGNNSRLFSNSMDVGTSMNNSLEDIAKEYEEENRAGETTTDIEDIQSNGSLELDDGYVVTVTEPEDEGEEEEVQEQRRPEETGESNVRRTRKRDEVEEETPVKENGSVSKRNIEENGMPSKKVKTDGRSTLVESLIELDDTESDLLNSFVDELVE